MEPRPNDGARPATVELWQTRAWLSMATMPSWRMIFRIAYSSSEFCCEPPRLAMASVRLTTTPSFSWMKVSSRVFFTCLAISSIASSQEMSSQSDLPGRRTLGLYTRSGFSSISPVSGFTMLCSWNMAAPFGHRPPSLIGLSGSPSILISFPSRTEQITLQPPEQ